MRHVLPKQFKSDTRDCWFKTYERGCRFKGRLEMSRVDLWLYVAQRVSAMVLAPLVIVHLLTIIYAIQGGLTAGEILQRTQGSLLWGSLYSLFVFAVAVHGSIGLRAIIKEMSIWHGHSLDLAMGLFGLSLLYLGIQAVRAVV